MGKFFRSFGIMTGEYSLGELGDLSLKASRLNKNID
jgi:hypothetical protein